MSKIPLSQPTNPASNSTMNKSTIQLIKISYLILSIKATNPTANQQTLQPPNPPTTHPSKQINRLTNQPTIRPKSIIDWLTDFQQII